MADLNLKAMDGGFIAPRRDMESDLPGYKPKPQLFPAGTPKSPYVKDAFGFIWHYQVWMDDMGDCLAPCWEAPPKSKVVVPVGIDMAKYAEKVPEHKIPEPPVEVAAPVAAQPVTVRGRRSSKAVA
jgi:hypothetical protein